MLKINGYFRLFILCWLLIYIFFFPAAVRAESLLLSEIEIINNNISGPGSESTIFKEGFSYNGNFSLTDKRELKKHDLLFNLGLRTQEDMSSDKQKLFLSRLQARFGNRDNNSVLNIGDTFEYFDQYVLNSSLKGVSYKYKTEKNESLTFLYGYDYPRWENIFSDDYQAVTRRSLGVNYKNNDNDILKWAVSYLNTDDQKAVDSEDVLYNNNVLGINWEYLPIPGLTVRGSLAYGITQESGEDEYRGTAHKINIFSNAKEGRASIEFERVAPEFKTLLGSSTTDIKKYKASLLYRYSDKINYNFDYVYFRDNLDGQKEVTTYNYRPGIGVNIKRLFDRRYASTSLRYNFNLKEATERKIEDNIVSLNYRDRFKMIDLGLNINYTGKKLEIEADLERENDITYNLSLSSRKRMKNYILRPALKFGYFKNNDQTEDSNDINFEKSLELGLDIPEKRISSNIRLGERESLRDDGDDKNKLFADLRFYYRPEILDKYNRGRVYLKFRYNDLSHRESEENDLRENSITAGINLGF